jgi:hypothetical protein
LTRNLGNAVMPATFRCYFLDPDNRIQAAEIIDAKGLGEAIEKGLAMLRQSRYPAIEIWEGAMKVFPVSTERAFAAKDG